MAFPQWNRSLRGDSIEAYQRKNLREVQNAQLSPTMDITYPFLWYLSGGLFLRGIRTRCPACLENFFFFSETLSPLHGTELLFIFPLIKVYDGAPSLTSDLVIRAGPSIKE